jgi:Tfp pilus assembly PilM family ATPase
MPQLIALDYDLGAARVVIASTQGRSLRVQAAFRIDWAGDGSADAATPERRGERLKAALAEHGVSKGEVLATIGRALVELKQLPLPPAPDDELPELVRFQAQREFHALTPESPLDYIPSPAVGDEPRSVLAATVDPALVAEVRKTCEAAGLKLRRLLLHPCATASLSVRALAAGDDRPRLLVEPGADEAEVTALVGRTVALVRATRMPGEPASADYARALSSELRRTTAAVQHQIGGRRIEEIQLCGTETELAAVVARLRTDVETPVSVVDPWMLLPAGTAVDVAPPEPRGRFAPLLGALADEAEGAAPLLDFVNPRRRPAPEDPRRRYVKWGLAGAAALLAIWLGISRQLSRLDAEFKELADESKRLEPAVKAAGELEKRAADMDKWLAGDVLWPAELRRLAERLPPAERTMLTELRLGIHKDGGEILFNGATTDTKVDGEIQTKLRDAAHTVVVHGQSHAPGGRYPWRFEAGVIVKNSSAENGPTAPKTAAPAPAVQAPAAQVPTATKPDGSKPAPSASSTPVAGGG